MKYFLIIGLIWIVLAGCEKEEIIMNQISFEIDGEEILCDRNFKCSGYFLKHYLAFYGESPEIDIQVSILGIHGKGAYSIDFDRAITIHTATGVITTSDVRDRPQGTGRIIIEKISKSGVTGTFECISLDNTHITNGEFQLRREKH